MINIIKRYKWFFLLLIANVIIGIIFPKIGKVSFQITKSNFLQILSVVPPIFVLLGLLDVWIDRSTMIKFVGKGSGLKGALIALLLGSVAAGPLYAAFPISMVMLKKRTSIFNVFIFIGAWSTTKIPMETFEIASLGYKFALTRLALSLIGIFIIAFILDKAINEDEKQKLYEKANLSI